MLPAADTWIALTFAFGGHEKYSAVKAGKYNPVLATAVGDCAISMKQSVVEITLTTLAVAGNCAVVPAVPVYATVTLDAGIGEP